MGCDLEGGKNGERFGGEWVKKEINIVKRKVGECSREERVD